MIETRPQFSFSGSVNFVTWFFTVFRIVLNLLRDLVAPVAWFSHRFPTRSLCLCLWATVFLVGGVVWRAAAGVGGLFLKVLVGLLEVCQTGEECRKRVRACVCE